CSRATAARSARVRTWSWPVRSRPTATWTRRRPPSRRRCRTGEGADMRRMSNAARLALAAVVVLGVAGCGRGITSTPGDAPNLEEWVANVKARPAPPLEPLPVMQQFETFEYAAQGLRDPFSDAF